MSIRQRWIAWQIVVVGTLTADAIVAWNGSSLALGIALALLAVMLALLKTTPANAIVLPRTRSEQVLFSGAAALIAISMAKSSDERAAIAIAVALVVNLALLRFVVRATRLSPWWLALVAWNPLVLLAIRG